MTKAFIATPAGEVSHAGCSHFGGPSHGGHDEVK